jgi:hypothetical protein
MIRKAETNLNLFIQNNFTFFLNLPLLSIILTTKTVIFMKSYTIGGLNFILFWNFDRNQIENDRYWQKIYIFTFHKLFENVQFFVAFAFKVFKKCYHDQNKFFLEQYLSLPRI